MITYVDTWEDVVEIPSEIEGYRVTGIGEGAVDGWGFSGDIIIPSSVESIDEKAFYVAYIYSFEVDKDNQCFTNDENGFAAIKANSTETTVVKRVETRLIAQTEGALSDASVKIFTDEGVNTTQIKTAEKNIVAETDEDSVCSCNCHKKGIIGFFWRIINFFNKLFRNNRTCDCGVAHY